MRFFTGEGFPRCQGCGQTAKKGEDFCSTCLIHRHEKQWMLEDLDECSTVEEVKNWLREHVIPRIT